MRRRTFTPPAFFFLGVLLGSALHIFFPIAVMVPARWNILGLLPLAVGIVLHLLAHKAFQQTDTTVDPYKKSDILITDGVFSVTRNPMYLGYLSILLAQTLLFGSLSPIIITVVYFVLVDRISIPAGEEKMAKDFGADWEEYRKKTRRWLQLFMYDSE